MTRRYILKNQTSTNKNLKTIKYQLHTLKKHQIGLPIKLEINKNVRIKNKTLPQ
jgi:hypothetical protein